jgi:hypothetical protein
VKEHPDFEPRQYSPLEPSYLRHYRKLPDGRIKWDVEVDQPRRYVDGGICATFNEAKADIEDAVSRDLKRIAESL